MSKWNSMWGTATSIAERREGNYAKDITLRYALKAVLDGEKIRVRFSNICGSEPVRITAASAAPYLGASEINTAEIVPLTFNGAREGVIEPGGELVSDEVEFRCRKGEDIAVSLYFKEITEFMSGVFTEGPSQENFFANGCYADAAELPRDFRMPTTMTYFLNTIDVLTDDTARTVVLFGDSITAQSWPDRLNRHFLDNGDNIAAIRRGVCGTRVLGQYDCLQYAHYGLSGKNRFVRECSTAGADTVLVFHGINDIIHPDGINPYRPLSNFPTLEELIGGYCYYIGEARRMGLKIYFGTLLPIEGWRTYKPWREDLRVKVNEWIRTTDEIDGFVDFDAAMRDPQDLRALRKEYNSGDSLHPSGLGAQALADAFYEILMK